MIRADNDRMLLRGLCKVIESSLNMRGIGHLPWFSYIGSPLLGSLLQRIVKNKGGDTKVVFFTRLIPFRVLRFKDFKD